MKGLDATDCVSMPASEDFSSTAIVITSLVRAGWGTTADVGTWEILRDTRDACGCRIVDRRVIYMHVCEFLHFMRMRTA